VISITDIEGETFMFRVADVSLAEVTPVEGQFSLYIQFTAAHPMDTLKCRVDDKAHSRFVEEMMKG